jgi:hypothetical protein
MCLPDVSRSVVDGGIGHGQEIIMAPYLFPFMIDPASLLLGVSLGAAAAVAAIIVIKNI